MRVPHESFVHSLEREDGERDLKFLWGQNYAATVYP